MIAAVALSLGLNACDECELNEDCDPTQFCDDERIFGRNVCEDRECLSDHECPDGQFCDVDGQCCRCVSSADGSLPWMGLGVLVVIGAVRRRRRQRPPRDLLAPRG